MSSISFLCKWSFVTLINLFSSVINDNSVGNLSEVLLKTSSTKSYLSQSLVSFFVQWKSIFSILTFEQFGVNSICKSASTPRLKSKTIALQYLGQISSKLAPKPFVRKLVSPEFFPPSLVLVVFLISGFYLTIWPLKLSGQYEPGNHIKTSG